MGLFLLIVVVLSLGALGLLIPSWTPSAIGVYIALWVMFCGATLWLWRPGRSMVLLRVAAGVLGLLMTLSMIDFVHAQITTRQPIVGGRTPLVGFFVIGVPALVFAVRGPRGEMDPDAGEADQQEQPGPEA